MCLHLCNKNPADASESFLVAQSNKGFFLKLKIGKFG